MRQKLFTLAAGVSAVLCAAIILLWITDRCAKNVAQIKLGHNLNPA